MNNRTYTIDCEFPNSCPHCGTILEPSIRHYHMDEFRTEPSDTDRAILLFQCPKCYEYFITAYRLESISKNSRELIGHLLKYTFTPLPIVNLPIQLESLSPKFLAIYKQANMSETYGLNEIAGLGYRKALEFLIKDYLIKIFPENELKIREEFLGPSINRIDDPTIKHLAQAATWIGNNETHYERRNPDKDIEDMKRFINAVAHFISFKLIADEAEAFVTSN